MVTAKTQIAIVMGLGAVTLLVGILGHLALTDIYHGEPDLSLEWGIVQVTALFIVCYITASLFMLKLC